MINEVMSSMRKWFMVYDDAGVNSLMIEIIECPTKNVVNFKYKANITGSLEISDVIYSPHLAVEYLAKEMSLANANLVVKEILKLLV